MIKQCGHESTMDVDEGGAGTVTYCEHCGKELKRVLPPEEESP